MFNKSTFLLTQSVKRLFFHKKVLKNTYNTNRHVYYEKDDKIKTCVVLVLQIREAIKMY